MRCGISSREESLNVRDRDNPADKMLAANFSQFALATDVRSERRLVD